MPHPEIWLKILIQAICLDLFQG